MSAAKDHPFVLSLDAIRNLKTIFDRLSSKDYCAAPDSGHKHFRPEFHLPTQLLIHTHNKSLTDSAKGIDCIFLHDLIMSNYPERSVTKDGDICYGLNRPYIRLVHNSAHDIVRDPSLYGEQFIPTQLVLAHAARLAKLAAKNQATSLQYTKQQDAINRLNVTIVTSFTATIDAALAEGFQIWNYADKTTYADGTDAYEQLLMSLGLVEFDYSSAVPKIYHDITAQDPGNDTRSTPLPYSV